ncbi:MAG: hypothetical protein ACOY3J_01235 [Bacillota bacterium]
MTSKKNDPVVNAAALSKKYKCDVKKIIQSWKKEKNDFEISQALGIDMLKILQIRQEISYLHEKERHRHLKKSRTGNFTITHKTW